MKQKNELDLLYKAYLLNACLSKSARELFYFPFLMSDLKSSKELVIQVSTNSLTQSRSKVTQ